MEFLALAESLQATVLSEGLLHATGSDTQSATITTGYEGSSLLTPMHRQLYVSRSTNAV